MNEKISVIIPIYNAAKFIDSLIESMINQTYQNIEILLIDDGSTDTSLKKCINYSRIYSNVIVYSQTNLGPSMARNLGIRHATGNYIMFVDADDIIEKEYCEKAIFYQQKEDYDLVCFGIKNDIFDMRGKMIRESISIGNKVELFEKDKIYKFCMHEIISGRFNGPCSKIYKSSIIINNNITFNSDIHFGEDLLFNLDYLMYCEKFMNVDETYYHYMQRYSNNRLTNKSKQRYSFYPIIIKELDNIELLYNKNDELLKELNTVKIHFAFSNINTIIKEVNYTNAKKEIEKILCINDRFFYDINHGILRFVLSSVLKTKNIFFIYSFSKFLNIFKENFKVLYFQILKKK